MTQSRGQSQTATRATSLAVDLRHYQSSRTITTSSLFLASQPCSTPRDHGGFSDCFHALNFDGSVSGPNDIVADSTQSIQYN